MSLLPLPAGVRHLHGVALSIVFNYSPLLAAKTAGQIQILPQGCTGSTLSTVLLWAGIKNTSCQTRTLGVLGDPKSGVSLYPHLLQNLCKTICITAKRGRRVYIFCAAVARTELGQWLCYLQAQGVLPLKNLQQSRKKNVPGCLYCRHQ